MGRIVRVIKGQEARLPSHAHDGVTLCWPHGTKQSVLCEGGEIIITKALTSQVPLSRGTFACCDCALEIAEGGGRPAQIVLVQVLANPHNPEE